MTVYNWKTGKINQPAYKNIVKCAEILELNPKERQEFLQAAGYLSEKYEQLLDSMPVVGLPVIRPYQFFGREQILQQIYLAWHKPIPESIIIIGPKRSGKTSLLNYLKQINQASYLRPEQPQGWPESWLPKFQFAFIDFQDANMYQLDTLLKDVLQQLNLRPPKQLNLADFSNIVKQKCNKPTVILIDNIKLGLSAPALDQAFWQNFCALGSSGKLSFVITCIEPPEKLEQYQDKLFPFLNLFGHNFYLKEFTEKEARELLAASPKPFTEAEIEKLLEESGCWPELLQKLCQQRLL